MSQKLKLISSAGSKDDNAAGSANQRQAARPKRKARAIAPLATLPVFFNLTDRRVIIIGGGAGAAWKAELLRACGARVDVFCIAPEEDMTEFLYEAQDVSFEGERALLPAVHFERLWQADDFVGAALIVAEVDSDDDAKEIFDAAQNRGVPVNVIDRPAYCQFQFGTIVNRSPVVLGISTDGAAPILGQVIRQRIESLLPRSLGAWAKAAKAARSEVKKRLSSAAARRRFWAWLSEQAFLPIAEKPAKQIANKLAKSEANTAGAEQSGHVTLVGAGPGDADLLTLKAVRALQSADIILFDHLVGDDILELARREAKRMLVGKRARQKSCKQDEINSLMIKFACQGKRVVRLKGGDPMLFGRAGEEIAALQAAHINFDVVPGITAASAAAARLGISLTHRDKAQSVRFITAHAKSGALPEHYDWQALSDEKTTLAFYMANKTIAQAAKKLIAHGMAKTTPAVLIASVTRPDEHIWHGTLEDLLLRPPDNSGAPVLAAIGQVFAEAKVQASEHELSEQEQNILAV